MEKTGIKSSSSQELSQRLNSPMIFNRIVSFFNSADARPEVASILLKKSTDIPIYRYEDCNPRNKGRERVDIQLDKLEVELAFYEGFIEKVEVTGLLGNEILRFTNKYSIGISSRRNIEELSNVELHTFRRFDQKLVPNPRGKDAKACKLILYLGDVIDYNRIIDVNANDISPEPQRIVLDENQLEATLYKEESTKIFEAVVYSDFIGVFNDEEPNGILQAELSKKFNLNTRKYPVPASGLLKSMLNILPTTGISYIQYVDLDLSLTKIEEHNRFLEERIFEFTDDSGQDTEEAYLSPLGLYQYQNYAFGADFNLLHLENQDLKTSISLNSGLKYGRSGIRFQPNTAGSYINTIQIPFSIQVNVVPEKRYGFSWHNRIFYYKILDSKNTDLSSLSVDGLVNSRDWLFSSELESFVNISTKGKLFLRYKITFDPKFIYENFSQLQFGYSFYIFKENGTD